MRVVVAGAAAMKALVRGMLRRHEQVMQGNVKLLFKVS